MGLFPAGIYDPRTKANKAGVVYNPTLTTQLYSEDVSKLDTEVVAIETELGTAPSGAYATVKAWLTALASTVIAHSTSHENGGGDEISVAGLSGELADEQKSNFLKLTDTPADYTDQAGKVVAVNIAEDALEFIDAGGGGGSGGLYGINVETLSDVKTLTPNTDKIYQYLDPNGSFRNITLDTASATAGDRFIVRNNAAYNSAYHLIIRQGATALDTLFPGALKKFIFDGTNWVPAEMGSGEDDNKKRNVNIGTNSYGNNGGTAVGYTAEGQNSGVAVGYSAEGQNSGVGVGYSSAGDQYGVAVGCYADAKSKRYSTAIGYYSICSRVGEVAINIGSDYDQENNKTIGGFAGSTSNATPTEIYAGGYSTSKFEIRSKSVLSFELQVCARDNTTGDCAIYHFKGGIKRDGSGNTTLLSLTKEVIHEDDASWDCDVTADDTNDSLKIEVTGDATNIVQWAARLDGEETHF